MTNTAGTARLIHWARKKQATKKSRSGLKAKAEKSEPNTGHQNNAALTAVNYLTLEGEKRLV